MQMCQIGFINKGALLIQFGVLKEHDVSMARRKLDRLQEYWLRSSCSILLLERKEGICGKMGCFAYSVWRRFMKKLAVSLAKCRGYRGMIEELLLLSERKVFVAGVCYCLGALERRKQ